MKLKFFDLVSKKYPSNIRFYKREPSCLFRSDRRTDIYDEANVRKFAVLLKCLKINLFLCIM